MATELDPGFEAFLHIVHVSDMHCKGAAGKTDVATESKVRRVIGNLRRLGRAAWAEYIEKRWQEGLAGHDPDAHFRMRVFLHYFAGHEAYAGIETWLLDTGDLSALGDIGSLKTALGWLDDYRTILDAKETLILHGNHDAWPGKFPLAASTAEIDKHQPALRKLLNKTWPQTSIQTDIPYSSAKLRLSAVNSTIGDKVYNTLARGHVGMDPPFHKTVAHDQLAELAKQTQQGFHTDGVTRDFRILALHHPVHYPPPKPTIQMSLRNDTAVASALADFDTHGRGKLAHLLLSGHTHQTYPARGALPPTSMGQEYAPLYEGQMQLIAGSLSQLPRYRDREKFTDADFIPQQCQILTFFASPESSRQGQLLMERRVVGRGSAGPYKFLPLPGTANGVESVLWDY